MSIVLYRIDERLIHGQVVVGWSQLHAQRIVVVDDDLATSAWEQELYTLGLAPEIASEFVSVDVARAQLDAWRASDSRIILLTRDINTMRRLAADGVLGDVEINVGGIHHAPGRRPVLPYVYLSPEDLEQLQALSAGGLHVSARDLPGGHKVPLEDFEFVERRK